MNIDFDSIYVSDLMQRYPIMVGAKDQLADVAKLFQHHGINSAPVVDREGVCVGIITSNDLVRFEATRQLLGNRWEHGVEFDTARYDHEPQDDRLRYDQVGSQMTNNFRSVSAGVALGEAITIMHEEHLHHLLILDGSGKPDGILSSLDILGFLVGRRTEQK